MTPSPSSPEKEALRSFNELTRYSYLIPAYQRGYRWTKDNVNSLLNDIEEFSPLEPNAFYCLQPLVVRKLKESEPQYEVIDGQQRLTTLFLVWHELQSLMDPGGEPSKIPLSYDSRPSTDENLRNLEKKIEVQDSDIDSHHIKSALLTIRSWLHQRKPMGPDLSDFIEKFRLKTRVIWYEPEDKDSIKIFTRLNVGKIPLTSEELIKAHLLKRGNFHSENSPTYETEPVRLKQLEIAGEWDRMEAAFHNEAFWRFLSAEHDTHPTRIRLLFQIFTDTWPTLKEHEEDPYKIFRAFLETSESSRYNNDLTKCWRDIKRIYQKLRDWFSDPEIYNKIGFLIHSGNSMRSIYGLSCGDDATLSPTKTEFKRRIHEKVFARVPQDLGSIQYGHAQLKSILLLHNVLTHLAGNDFKRFPFDLYGAPSQSWDVEHIHSVTQRSPENPAQQLAWLERTIEFLDVVSSEGTEPNQQLLQDQINSISDPEQLHADLFEELQTKILKLLSEGGDHEDVNDLSNLVLLDASTNRGYGNAVFPLKRQTIIDKEKQGTFMPICTRNAFLKVYSKSPKSIAYWGKDDRESYFNDIENKLQRTPLTSNEPGQ